MAKHVILGSGPAGLKAAEEIRRLSPDDEITVITEDSRPPYYRYYLPDIVAGTKGEDALLIHPVGFYEEQKIDLLLGKRVAALACDEKKVELADGSSVRYDKLLIATGSLPRRGTWPGGDFTGILYLRTWDNMLAILHHLQMSRNAVVAGGGLLGIELAWGFREQGLDVTWLIREDRFWPQMLDAAGSRIMEDRVVAAGVGLRKGDEIKEIVGAGGKVVGVRTARGEEISADTVGVAIGAIPSLQFLDGSGVRHERGILVDEQLRTSVGDIFAAGDIAQVFDPVYGEHRVHTNWENAERQGRVAGANMVGQERKLPGGIDHNLMKLYDVPFVSMGLANPPAEGYVVLSREEPGKYRKLVLKDDKIVGATMLGDTKGQRALYDLIVEQVEVGVEHDRLLDPAFSLASLVPKNPAKVPPAASS